MKEFDTVLKELKRVVDKAEVNQIDVLQIQELEEILRTVIKEGFVMICEKCNFISNSVFTTDEGCSARLENNIWSKGCQYHSSDNFMRFFANKYIGTAPKSKEEMIDSLLSLFELDENEE